jgi:hypothetical protein
MTRARLQDSACADCRRVAAFKARGDELREFIGPGQRAFAAQRLPPETTEWEQTALTWSLQIIACLKREMATHARCGACSILIGEGHLEAGAGGYCGTCAITRGLAEEANGGRVVIGRRGWSSDHDR